MENTTPNKRRISIFDTTLRDGEQAPGCHLTPEQKVTIAWQLRKMSVDVIEAGFPASSAADFEAVQAIAQSVGQGTDAPQITGLARCHEKDVEAVWNAVRSATHPRIHVFIASSDIHMKHKLKMTREEVIRRAVQAVTQARSYTPNVQFSAEDASRADYSFLVDLVTAVIQAGASTVNIPDTVGYAMPEEFAARIESLRRDVPGIDKTAISVHCHDDLGLAVANSLAAVRAGVNQVECTVNGIGERAGNCSLEEVVMAVRTRPDFFQVEMNVDPREITAASRMVASAMGLEIPINKAIVGRNAFAHASGVHQDGMIKHAQTYEIIKPEDVGAAPSQLILTSRSGRRALLAELNSMGHHVDDNEAESIYERFKIIADRMKIVTRRDLSALMSG